MSNLYPGILVTIIGLMVVFSVLLLIMCVLKIMEFVFYTLPNKRTKPPEPVLVPVIPDIDADEDDSELVAALTAAVAVYLDADVSSIAIKSYKQISTQWGDSGRRGNVFGI